MKQILLLAVTGFSLLAADATGTWSGTLTAQSSDGGTMDHRAHLVLKQQGTTLTGTAGPNSGEQYEIKNGKAEEGNLTFEVQINEGRMKFSLKQEGDEIKGDISRDRDGRMQTAKLTVKREKQ